VLKPNRAFGGTGVLLGPSVTQPEWEAALDRALADEERWVTEMVQRIERQRRSDGVDLPARASRLAHRYGLQLPAWVSGPITARAVIGLVRRLRAPRHAAPASQPLAAGQDCHELVGGPVMSSAGER